MNEPIKASGSAYAHLLFCSRRVEEKAREIAEKIAAERCGDNPVFIEKEDVSKAFRTLWPDGLGDERMFGDG